MTRYAAIAMLIALTAVVVVGPSSARASGDPKIVAGTVYSCIVDGVRRYRSTKPDDLTDCRTIKYSFLEVTQPDEGWKTVDLSSGMYFYEKGITRQARKTGIWVMYAFAVDQPASGGIAPHRSIVEKWSMDCANQSYAVQQRTFYAGGFGKGQVVGTWQPLAYSYNQFVIPNTNGDSVMKAACKASGR